MRSIFNGFINILKQGFAAAGFVWTLAEIIEGIFPDFNIETESIRFVIIMAFSAVIVFQLASLAAGFLFFGCDIKNREGRIKIRIGDILNKKNGSKVIGINDKLQNSIDTIGPNSLHSQFLRRYPQNDLDRMFSEALSSEAENGRVSMGKTFRCPMGDEEYLFLVMSELEAEKAPSTERRYLRTALESFFRNQSKFEIKDKRLYIPVLGKGSAAMRNLDYFDTIKMIAGEYVYSQCIYPNSANRIEELVIVLQLQDLFRMGCMSFVKMKKLQSDIRHMSELCSDCLMIHEA